MNANEIRQQFLDFFASKNHTIVPSSPVVPHDDPTLMFANAGMNQFKPIFLGTVDPNSEFGRLTRAANTQKCIRAGGKHNDLDDVGQDTYHHTFFEMLGNWSFGDYFKKEAIEWAWELLTEVWGIDKNRLHATYFAGDKAEGLEPDSEAAELWRTVTDIDPSHIHPGNKKDNFWEMGDTGPCGPCSEIHVDLTPDVTGTKLVNAGDARVIELWNLVFIQFNRAGVGKLSPLPSKHVDTGMGFERLCAILQCQQAGSLRAVSNYDTDVFVPIFKAIQKRTGAPDYTGTLPSPEPQASACAAPQSPGAPLDSQQSPEQTPDRTLQSTGTPSNAERPRGLKPAARDQLMIDVSYRVIADHVRCLTFALTDGAMPSNEGRGYVLRRILRRAVRYGRQYLDMHEPFLCDLVEPVAKHMSGAFPELTAAHGGRNIKHVAEIIRDEEASFLKTLDRGIRLFNEAAHRAIGREVERTQGWERISSSLWTGSPDSGSWKFQTPKGPVRIQFSEAGKYYAGTAAISGQDAFKLHDTYGFPIDLTQLMAEERGLTVDIEEYERLMEEARRRAKSKVGQSVELFLGADTNTEFVGHRSSECEGSVTHLVKGESLREMSVSLKEGETGALVLDISPFYAEQGGQVGDRGVVRGIDEEWVFEVEDTRRAGPVHVHYGRCVRGTIYVLELPPAGSGKPPAPRPGRRHGRARASVSLPSRLPTQKNHTATHLLNWALREVLCAADERGRPHVQQKGSLVDPEKTRFDFSHSKPMADREIGRVEALVNERIEEGLTVDTNGDESVDQAAARKINTLRAVFGEKYPDKVRVVSIGPSVQEMLADPENEKWMGYSVEFCGGTHVKNTSEIERFVITTEEAVAKGIRRVVGVTGETAKQAVAAGEALLGEVSALAGDGPQSGPYTEPNRGREGAGDADLPAKLTALQKKLSDAVIPVVVRHQLVAKLADLQKEAKKIEKRQAVVSGDAVKDRVAELLAAAETIGGVTVVVGDVPSAGADALRGAIDWVRNKTPASAVLLATETGGKVVLIAGMSKAVVAKGVKAGDLIKELAPLVGGKGGGRPDMAQGGGTRPRDLPVALERALELLLGWLAV